MSWQPASAAAEAPCGGAVEQVIEPRLRDLGDGFTVRRILPFAKRRSLGPFVFFDHMGPTRFAAGQGLDVRPHPHIGLATVTYLFAGEMMHRDSLGSAQAIRPGAVNWMVAGRGIAHAERTPPEARRAGATLHGAQLWVALPRDQEEMAPSFAHHPAAAQPALSGPGWRLRLVAGTLLGATAPVTTQSPLFLADCELDGDGEFVLPAEHAERGAYVVEGAVTAAGRDFGPANLLVFALGAAVSLSTVTPSRLLLLGGAPLDGERHLWWNFVSSSPERLERAKAAWKAGRFAAVPGDAEFIPLPE